ncbi:MAG TPA: PHP domain-containing protein [Lachnospiraceae bacterium]|jgi:histidinol phosphatase-like PHP family hydrolase|nr:PHP domain-containing protein [Lachnospiraceae bacterium]
MAEFWSNKDFPYLYDTHVHTRQASACGACTGADMARVYKEAGYTGIMITDHFFYGNTAIDRNLEWTDWVEAFSLGYADAKAEGDRIGLQVFWGWESGYHGTEFLIFGLDKEWLLTHPEIRDASIEEQYKLVHEGGGIVIHAHPYREEDYIDEICLYPEYVDAVEAVNACHANPISTHHKNPLFDLKARNYAREHHFPVTAGSDAHFIDLLGGGMAFQEKLRDVDDFVQAIYTKRICLLTDGHNSCMNYTVE